MFRMMSWAIGCDERMNDSVQQVHSSPCSQITGMITDERLANGLDLMTEWARVCPEKHGYLAGDDSWVEASYVKHVTKKYRDLPLEEVPREHVLFWTMYRELFESSGPG